MNKKSKSKNEFSSPFTSVRGCSILILAFIKNAIKCLPLSACCNFCYWKYIFILCGCETTEGIFFNIKMMNLFPIRFFFLLFDCLSSHREEWYGRVWVEWWEREREIMERTVCTWQSNRTQPQRAYEILHNNDYVFPSFGFALAPCVWVSHFASLSLENDILMEVKI